MIVTTPLAWDPGPELTSIVTWSPTLNELPEGSVYKVTATAPLASVDTESVLKV